jgi:hypothetical protein
MNKRLERSEQEIEQLMARGGGRGGRGGRGGGQAGRAAGPGGIPDNVRYQTTPAPIGGYRIVMNANGRTMEQSVSILRDEWWRDRR